MPYSSGKSFQFMGSGVFLPVSITQGMLSVGGTPFLFIGAIHTGQSLS